uniref:Integrase core domain containing protein n=1 Tax=Solanum tuberosum TaxID=4113 RepID=M1DZJ6_SOLTU
MAPKQAPQYTKKGKSKSVAPSRRLLDKANDEKFVPPTTRDYLTAPELLGTKPSRLALRVTRSRSLPHSLKMGPHSLKSRSPTLVLAACLLHHLMPIAQETSRPSPPPLQTTLVRNFPVDISKTTIRRFIYGSAHTMPINIAEYDYRMGIVQSGAFQRNVEQRETLLRWIAQHIAEEGKGIKWVRSMTLPIIKASLIFAAKFFWLVVRTRLSRTQADNVVTWDRAVMIATLMEGLEINFSRILIIEINERSFKTTTTLPFPCLIFHHCREASVPIWHCDRLLEVTKIVDIGFIRDVTNIAASRREPQVDVPPLGTDVEHIQVDD